MSLLVDDHIRIINRKLNEATPSGLPKDIPTYLLKTIRKSRTASTLTLYYVLHVTRLRNKEALTRILPKVVRTEGDLTWDDNFLHPFTSQLIGMSDDFSSEEFCSLVFDSFLLKSVTRENVARHTLRLVEYIFQKLPALRLSSLQNQLAPKDEVSIESWNFFSGLPPIFQFPYPKLYGTGFYWKFIEILICASFFFRQVLYMHFYRYQNRSSMSAEALFSVLRNSQWLQGHHWENIHKVQVCCGTSIVVCFHVSSI